MGTIYSEFIERLRRSVQEHEERIIRLESGTEKAFRRSRSGDKEDISLQTADHYRRLAHHLHEVISRYDLKIAQQSNPERRDTVACRKGQSIPEVGKAAVRLTRSPFSAPKRR